MGQMLVKKQPWWQLLSIQAGGTICLPIIMIGQIVCQKFGWLAALLSVGLGNLFLLSIGYALASLSTYRPQSTVEHAVTYFGNRGRLLFASLMMFSMQGWFGIQLNVMNLSCEQLFNLFGITTPHLLRNVVIGIMISAVMCLGMKAMKGLSYVSAPLLGLTLLYAICSSKGSIPLIAPPTISWLGGLSLIIGANISAVIDLPTYFRHAKSGRDAKICILVLYGIIVPVIEIVGVYLSAVTGGNSILDVLQEGHGPLWMIWISCFVLLSGWATNNANLYSSITSSYSLPGRVPPIIRTLILGITGTAIACFNPLGNIENVLDVLSITIGGMGAVMLANYLLEKKNAKYRILPWVTTVSWLSGIVIGMISFFFNGLTTGVPAFDAFIASFLIQIIYNLIYQRVRAYETIDNR
jgi:cytosine permease